MKLSMKKVSMLGLAVAVTTIGATASVALGGFALSAKCGPDACLDVWRPVICPNGVVYSNACYAAKACQKNCTPY